MTDKQFKFCADVKRLGLSNPHLTPSSRIDYPNSKYYVEIDNLLEADEITAYILDDNPRITISNKEFIPADLMYLHLVVEETLKF